MKPETLDRPPTYAQSSTGEQFLLGLFQEAPPGSILADWERRKYTEIETKINRPLVLRSVDAFHAFQKLPEKLKHAIRIEGEKGRGKGTLGYVVRTPENDDLAKSVGKKPEHKEYFQYAPRLKQERASEIKAAGPVAKKLIDKLHRLWVTMEQIAYATAQRMEKENAGNSRYIGFVEKFFPDGITEGRAGLRHPNLTFRLLTYKKVGPRELAANGHYDGGSLTFSILESAPGLQVGDQELMNEQGEITRPEEMHEVIRPDGNVLFWPGINFKRIDPSVQGTWHNVRQYSKDSIKVGEENRWAAVTFLDQYNEIAPTIEETQGVAQRKSA